MPSFRDDDRAPAYQLQRLAPQALPTALALLRLLAQEEQAVLPPCFRAQDRRHAALCRYLTQPAASHWHLGLHASPDHDTPTHARFSQKIGDPLLGLLSGFMIPDPLASAPPEQQGSPGTPLPAAFFINSLILAPQHRGRGLGRFCLDRLARLARARGAGRLYVALSNFNETALPFYRRLGFHPSPLIYWSLGRRALLRGLQHLERRPLALHRCTPGAQPGLVRLSHPGGGRLDQPAPPLDLGFGFDFGLDAWEAWLAPAALADPEAWDGQVYALALRQLHNWQAAHAPQAGVAPKFGVTGLAARVPPGGALAEARVLHLDLSAT